MTIWEKHIKTIIIEDINLKATFCKLIEFVKFDKEEKVFTTGTNQKCIVVAEHFKQCCWPKHINYDYQFTYNKFDKVVIYVMLCAIKHLVIKLSETSKLIVLAI